MSNRSAIRWEQGEDGVVELILDDPDQSANTMNELFQSSLRDTVARLEEEKGQIKGVIITSAKPTFFAGGDLNLLSRIGPEDAPALFQSIRQLNDHLRTLETLGVPVVAALNGTALGGGFEIALACHHRIAMSTPGARFGLPEVTLGLLPGGGGIVRTVRILGVQRALTEVLLLGPRLRPEKALQMGLLDEVVESRDEMMARARAWIAEHPKATQPWDAPGYRMPGGTPKQASLAANLPAFPANLKKQLKGAPYPAPRAIMAAAVEGAALDFDTASRIESRYFVQLATGSVAKNMIRTFFFGLQKVGSGASRPAGFATWKPRRVGVLGAGMMGHGIAYVTSRAGIDVVLKDVSRERAEAGKARVRELVSGQVRRGRMTEEESGRILDRIRPTGDAGDLEGCDMIIEAVFEDRELKARVTREAEHHAAPDALICSNTSTLPITGLATACSDPARFIGLHFFSPVHRMPLVEIIVGRETSDESLARAFDYVQAIRKTPIVVNDSRGFFTSRVFATFAMEGIAMLGEGLNPSSIEQAALQAGMPVGPLAVNDEISLTLGQHVRRQTIKDYEAEGKTYTPHPADRIVDQMCDEFGRPGKAAGAGFYDYPTDGPKRLWPGLWEHYVTPEGRRPGPDVFEEMKDRFLYVQSVETVRCMEEGVLRSVEDANVGSILGIGAPPWTGGWLQFVNWVGHRRFVERARSLAKRYGARFEPPRLLEEMAERGERF